MSEAKLFATNGFNGGVSAGIRADNYEEFLSLAKAVYGDATGEVFANEVFAQLLKAVPSAQATATVAAAVGPVTVVSQPASVIGNGAVAQPGAVPQPAQSAAPAGALPPTVVYPGDCVHGVRPYRESMAKGQMWRRHDCASPWVKGNDAHNATRCRSVNV